MSIQYKFKEKIVVTRVSSTRRSSDPKVLYGQISVLNVNFNLRAVSKVLLRISCVEFVYDVLRKAKSRVV